MPNLISIKSSQISTPFDWSSFFELEPIELLDGWKNPDTNTKVQVFIANNNLDYYFGFKVFAKPSYFTDTKLGDFRSELWKRDVAEIFILDQNEIAYQEINIAPNGAYWSQYFESYRNPNEKKYSDIMPANFFSKILKDSWSVGFSFNLKNLSVTPSGEKFRFNVTAITDSPNYNFFTLGPKTTAEPDFHANIGSCLLE